MNGLTTSTLSLADINAVLDASPDPALAARKLIGHLNDYVRVAELLTPAEMHKHLEELAGSEVVWAGVADAADTYRETVLQLVRDYVEERCD
jgi:hypothetical protein